MYFCISPMDNLMVWGTYYSLIFFFFYINTRNADAVALKEILFWDTYSKRTSIVTRLHLSMFEEYSEPIKFGWFFSIEWGSVDDIQRL